MELPNPEELELPILSVYARAKRQGRDRRVAGMTQVDPATGLPSSGGDILPAGKSIGGERLALSIRVEPELWARVFLKLDWKAPHTWTEEEAILRDELTLRIKKAIRNMKERGLFEERYLSEFDGTPMPLAQDGYCVRAAITQKGLDEAVSRCAGTKWESGPVSILAGAPEDVIAKAPQYAQEQLRREGGR